MTPAPFDTVAAEYDADFTEHTLGRWLRAAVWAHLDEAFRPGDDVLELGCGTGEDAVYLARRGVQVHATDGSPAMLAIARHKALLQGVSKRVTFEHLDLNNRAPDNPPPSPHPHSPRQQYDGAFSNFGAVNALPDRRPLAEALARWIRPGGCLVLVVMGPLCPWEWGWYLAHGRIRTAFRRFRSGGLAHVGSGAMMRVWYPSPRRVRREFAPYFRHRETVGLGVLLPPTFARGLVDRKPAFFERLAALDRKAGRTLPGSWLNDHYLTVFERTDVAIEERLSPFKARHFDTEPENLFDGRLTHPAPAGHPSQEGTFHALAQERPLLRGMPNPREGAHRGTHSAASVQKTYPREHAGGGRRGVSTDDRDQHNQIERHLPNGEKVCVPARAAHVILFACPQCRHALEHVGPDELRCEVDGLTFLREDGIWRFLTPERAAHYRQFLHEYATIRRAEGRGDNDPAYYRALPFEDRTGRHRRDWRIRARSHRAFVESVLEPLEARHQRPLTILDLGAGNGWLSYRLAQRGHQPVAIDLQTNGFDGLGAHAHYDAAFLPVQAEFGHLPFADGQFDLAIFNASLHYATAYAAALGEVLRVLKPEGRLTILDSPVYRDGSSGAQMVREREAAFAHTYGFASNALACENYLTDDRLGELAAALHLRWQIIAPSYGWRWAARPWIARLLRRREPARFLIITGSRIHENP